jgi:hypothetical protein
VVTAVNNAFSENTWYSALDINNGLKKIYTDFGLSIDGRGIASKITLYFDAKVDNKENKKGWMLNKKIN